MAKIATNEERLRRAIRSAAKDWAAIYAKEPDGPHLIKSLLLGLERGIRDRLGKLPEDQRGMPPGVASRAFWTGSDMAHTIPNTVIDRLR